MKNVTASDVGIGLGISKIEAAGLLKALVRMGSVSIVGVRKTSTGKGRPTPVYGVEDSVMLNLSSVIAVSGEISPLTERKPKKEKIEDTQMAEVT